MKLQPIQLSDIKFDDNIFSLSPSLPEEPPQKLVQSISRVGLLHPPIVVEITEKLYRICSGRLRLLAAQELNIQTCKCHVFKATTHPVDIFTYIYEEASHTNIPLISKAIFLKKAGGWLEASELSDKFMAGFGLKANSFNVKKLQHLAELEINIQEELLAHRLDEKICHELVKLEFIDRMGLFDIIMKLSLSVGNQRKLLITSHEVATRTRTTIASFLGQTALTSILTNHSLNTPQKTAAFMARLQELRFPLLSEAEHEFKIFVQSLPLTKEMTVSHSPSFERDELALSITCHSKEEIASLIDTINHSKNKENGASTDPKGHNVTK